MKSNTHKIMTIVIYLHVKLENQQGGGAGGGGGGGARAGKARSHTRMAVPAILRD